MSILGQKLRTARKLRKMNQKQLAELINVSKSSISEWESGKHQPSTKQIRALCEALQIDPNWLLGEEQSRLIRETSSDYFVLDDGEILPIEAKKELDSFIEYLKMKYKGGIKNETP